MCKLTALIASILALALPTKASAAFPRSWFRDALCVHRYEGSWTDPGAPYFGGMQFDLPTWRANGGFRYARYPHHATPHEQLLVAYMTWKRRGWHPWPNTARMCGLL
jgi:resuscitation-promoting factor RpfA